MIYVGVFMMTRQSLFVLLMLSSFVLVSCGEHKNQSTAEKSFTPGEIRTDCEINGKNLEKFFDKVVTSDIECLGKSLSLFVRVVEPNSPRYAGYLSREILERYIRQNPSLSHLVANMKYFALFFEVSNLIFGDTDNKDYLKAARIAPLTDFFKFLNVHAIEMKQLLKRGKKLHREALTEAQRLEYFNLYVDKRKRLIRHSEELSKELLKLFELGNKRYASGLDLSSILDIIGGDFPKYKSLLFVKKVIASGDETNLTQKELSYLIKIAPDLFSFFYDVSHFGEVVFANSTSQYMFYRQIVQNFRRLLYYSDSGPEDQKIVLFHMRDIEEGLKTIEEVSSSFNLDLDTILPLLPEVKRLAMMSPDDSVKTYPTQTFNTKDLLNSIDLATKLISSAIDYSKLFQTNRSVLLSTKKIYINELSNAEDVSESRFSDFALVATRYRFFKGLGQFPVFGNKYQRSEAGLIEIGIFQELFHHVAMHYEREMPCGQESLELIRHRPFGRPNEDLRGCYKQNNGADTEDYKGTLTRGQLEFVVKKLEIPLNKLGLLTLGREYIASDNATLMTDLFQFQSNASDVIDKPEAVEFALQMVASLGMKEDLVAGIKTFCETYVDQNTGDEVFALDCTRKHFAKLLSLPFTRFVDGDTNEIVAVPSNTYTPKPDDYVIRDQYSYADYLQRFAKFLLPKDGTKELIEFTKFAERFTRSCYDYDDSHGLVRPYSGTDLMGLFAGLFNVESTIIRFDKNGDNVLTGDEMDATYRHFKDALDAIVKDSIGGDGLRKLMLESIFYFLVNNLRRPSNTGDMAELILYRLNLKHYKKIAKIDQNTIAAILSQIKAGASSMKEEEGKIYCKVPDYR